MNHVVDTAAAAVARLSFPAVALRGGLSGPDPRTEVPLDQVSFTHADTPSQLRSIAHLREAIALPASVREAPAFARLEKKETNWGS